MKWSHTNYIASVAFALMVAYLIGNAGALIACMIAWASCYAGAWVAMNDEDENVAEDNGIFRAIAFALLVIAVLVMIVAAIVKYAA